MEFEFNGEPVKVLDKFPNLKVGRTGNVYGKYGRLLKSFSRGYFNACGQEIHRLVAMAWVPNPHFFNIVDHIDGNTEDNRVENLRWVDQRGNCTNRSEHRAGKLPGASLLKNGRWRARYMANGKNISIAGSFSSMEEAHAAYLKHITA